MQRGGRRLGAGRKSALSVGEKLRAGNLCDAMQREAAKERSFVLAYGEDGAQEILAKNAALEAARSAYLSLSPEEREAYRAAYAAQKHGLQVELKETIDTSAYDVNGRKRLYLRIGSAQGKKSKRPFGDDELTRDEIIKAVAKIMTAELGRSVSASAVKKAWELQRKINAPDAIALQKAIADAERKILK